jgi:hypothetical protein
MTDFKRRVDRLEDSILSKSGEKYRLLCFCYNLRYGNVDDEDLIEYVKAAFEGREIDPEIEKRFYAPIPPSAPTHLVNEAKDRAWSGRFEPLESVEDIYAEILEYERDIKAAKEALSGMGVNTHTED